MGSVRISVLILVVLFCVVICVLFKVCVVGEVKGSIVCVVLVWCWFSMVVSFVLCRLISCGLCVDIKICVFVVVRGWLV